MPLLSLSFPTSSSSLLHHQHGHHASRDVCGSRFATYFSLKPHGLRSNRSIRFRVLLSSSSSSHPSSSIDGTGSGNTFGDVTERDSELEVDEEEDSDSEAPTVDRWDVLADTIDVVITPTIYQIPSSKAHKETHFGQPFQSDNSRVSRKRPLEELVLRDGISGLISNSIFPDELKSFKSKANEQTMDARYLKLPARRSQKLSDKITSLQKVVSPYGKTDTTSVLQETCMYIKIAHQEIWRLTVSYFGTKPFLHPQWYDDKTTYKHEDIDELRKECLDYFLSLV